MATTKELLEKAMLKVGAHADAPTTSSISLPAATSVYQRYTPTEDGWMCFYGTPETDTPSAWVVRPNNRSDFIRTILHCWANISSHYYVKAYRGQEFAYKVSGGSVRDILTYFIKSVGGGLRLLAETLGRGGAIWLRLRVCLTRRFAKVLYRRFNFDTTQQSKLPISREEQSSLTSVLRTGCCKSTAQLLRTLLSSHSTYATRTDGLMCLNLSTLRTLFEKVHRLLSSTRQRTTQVRERSLLSSLRLNSFAMGGI